MDAPRPIFELGPTALRPVEREDLLGFFEWSRDVETETLSGWTNLRSKEAFFRHWIDRIENGRSDHVPFAILHESALVGRAELALIDEAHRRAAVGIVLPGRDVRRRGVGSTALRLLLEYAFTIRNLERVVAEVYGFNAPAQRFFERFGFVREGVLRGHEVHHGARRDLVVFGLLAGEFRERHVPLFPVPEV